MSASSTHYSQLESGYPLRTRPQPAGTQSTVRSRELGASLRAGLVTTARRALRCGRGRGRAGEGGGGAKRGGGCGGFESASFLAAGAGVGLVAPAPLRPRSSRLPSSVRASRTLLRVPAAPSAPAPLPQPFPPRGCRAPAVGSDPARRPRRRRPRGARSLRLSSAARVRGGSRRRAAGVLRRGVSGGAPLAGLCAGPGAAPRPPARGLPMVQRRSGCRRR